MICRVHDEIDSSHRWGKVRAVVQDASPQAIQFYYCLKRWTGNQLRTGLVNAAAPGQFIPAL